jgi:hypothetical protein
MEAYRETVKQPKINNQPVITTPSTYLSPSHLEELIEEEIQKNNDAKKGYKPIIKRSPIPRRQRLR